MPGIFLQPLLAKLLKHKTGLPPFLKEGFWLTAKSVCSSVVEGKLIPTKDSQDTLYIFIQPFFTHRRLSQGKHQQVEKKMGAGILGMLKLGGILKRVPQSCQF